MNIKDLANKLLFKRNKVSSPPETKLIVDALRSLAGKEEFLLFRALIQCYYADCVKALASCSSDNVDIIRGQMTAFDRIYTLTSEEGINALESEEEQKKELMRLMAGVTDDSIY